MPRFVISALALVLCVVGAAAPALAQPGQSAGPAPYVGSTDPPGSEPPATRTSWYGWQTLAVDAAALGGVISAEQEVMTVGFGTMLFGAPLVHAPMAGPGRRS